MSVGVKLSWTVRVTVVQGVDEYLGVEEPDTDTVLVLEFVGLAVSVEVRLGVPVIARLFDIVVVADGVFVLAGVAVLHGLCVGLFELLVDDVYVAEEVDVFVEDAERVVAPE